MIGIPRIPLTMIFASRASAGTCETRMSAHTMPSSVLSTSAVTVISTVTTAPWSRSGRYSAASRQKVLIVRARPRLLQLPLLEDAVDRAVALQLRDGLVHAVQERLVALLHPDADAARHERLIGLDGLDGGIVPEADLVRQDREVAEAGLQPANVHVAEDVRQGVVDLDLLEHARLAETVHVRSADLRPDDLALEVLERLVVLRVLRGDDEALAVRVDGLAEVDDLPALRGDVHRRGDDVDLVALERRDERAERHALDVDAEPLILGDGANDVDHDALDRVRLRVEERERHARRRRA